MKRCISLMVFAIWTVYSVSALAIELDPIWDIHMNPKSPAVNNAFDRLDAGGELPANPRDFSRLMMRWDLTGVSGIVGDATLRMTVSNQRTYNRVLEVFKIKSGNGGWTETNVTPALGPGGTPWVGDLGGGIEDDAMGPNSTGMGQALATDGYEGAGGLNALDAINFISLSLVDGDTIEFTIVQSVIQQWLTDPDGSIGINAGLVIRDSNEDSFNGPGGGSDFFLFHSREGADGNRPKLIFQVPEPSSLVLAGMGLAGLLLCLWRKRNRKA